MAMYSYPTEGYFLHINENFVKEVIEINKGKEEELLNLLNISEKGLNALIEDDDYAEILNLMHVNHLIELFDQDYNCFEHKVWNRENKMFTYPKEDCESLFAIELDYSLNPFAAPFNSPQDFVKQLQKIFKELIPDDFDAEKYLIFLSNVYYG